MKARTKIVLGILARTIVVAAIVFVSMLRRGFSALE